VSVIRSPNSPLTLAITSFAVSRCSTLYKQVLCTYSVYNDLACFTFIFAPALLYSLSLTSREKDGLALLRRPSRLLFLTAAVSSLPLRSERVRVRARVLVRFLSLRCLSIISGGIFTTPLFSLRVARIGVLRLTVPRVMRAPVRGCADNGLIMLYLHYGKQFVKTVLSATPGVDAGQEAQLRATRSRSACIAIYRCFGGLLVAAGYLENS